MDLKDVAYTIAGYNMSELNDLTLTLTHYGIAASFNQFIPEIHSETASPEEGADPSLDNAFGGREPG